MSSVGDLAVDALIKYPRNVAWTSEDIANCRRVVQLDDITQVKNSVLEEYTNAHEYVLGWIPTVVGAVWNPMGRSVKNYVAFVVPETLAQIAILEKLIFPPGLWLDFFEQIDRRFLFRAADRLDLPLEVQSFLAQASELVIAKKVAQNVSFPDYLRAMATLTAADKGNF